MVGNGSNTVTIGNTSITDTYLRGTVRTPVLLTPSSTVPDSPIAGMIYFDSTANKHKGYDGTIGMTFIEMFIALFHLVINFFIYLLEILHL